MKLQIILWFLVGIIAFGVGFYIYKDISPKSQQEIIQVIQGSPLDKVEITPIVKVDSTDTPISVPDLNKPIIFGNNISDEEKKKTTEKVNELIDELKKDSSLVSNWIELGLYRKLIGDYESARDAWEYASKIRPLNSVSFMNLGDLYHFFLKDFEKAEQNFRKAIENSADNTQAYIGLHELYKYSYKQDTTLVTDVLLEGISQNPNNINLLTTLAAYYKERGNMAKGDITNAQKYYEQARDKAEELGNTQLVNLLNQELTELINL